MSDLKAQINSLLAEQGTNTTYDDISSNFRYEQFEAMLKHNIHLIDMDRWAHIEGITKRHYTFDEFKLTIDFLNDKDIEVLELN